MNKTRKNTPKETFIFRDEFFKGGIQYFNAQVNGVRFKARFREKVSKEVFDIFNDRQRKFWLVTNIKEPLDKEETQDEKELQEKPEHGGGDDTEGEPEQEAKEDTQEKSVKGEQTSFD